MNRVDLNFHHLQYFWEVAREGHLTRAARRLRVAPSALSSQIRLLEEQVGVALFARVGRRLVLTEAGEMAFAYAASIFDAGAELVATLRDGRRPDDPMRVGAVATLSRNFQRSFLRPLLQGSRARLVLRSGSLDGLLAELRAHALDVVLSNQPPVADAATGVRTRLLARQPVSIVCSVAQPALRWPGQLAGARMVVPGHASALRAAFDALCHQHGVAIDVVAEIDDMATMRLIARDTDAFVLVPSIVVRDELAQGVLHEVCVVEPLAESFYASTLDRRFPHPLLGALVSRESDALLAGGTSADFSDRTLRVGGLGS